MEYAEAMPNQVDTKPFVPPTQEGLVPVLVGRANRLNKKARTDEGPNNNAPITNKKVRDFEVESNVGGEERIIFGCRGPFKIYTPVFKKNVEADTYWSNRQVVEVIQCRICTPPNSIYTYKGHTNHLVEEELVTDLHAHLNGKILK